MIPSFLFAGTPWILATPAGLASGFAAHALWFTACEKLLPPSAVSVAVSSVTRAGRLPARTGSVPSERSDSFQAVRVLAVFDETPEIRTFRFTRPAGFEFLAGQFLTVSAQVEGRTLTRCYSISSAPEATGYMEISVKRQGVVSGALHATLRPGSLLSVKRAAGRFVYPQGDERPIVLLGGGIGITPLLSMLRHAAAAEPSRPVTLLLSVRTEGEIPFRDELWSLPRRHPQIHVTIAVTRGTTRPGFFPGRIDAKLLGEVVPEPRQAMFFLCGPLPMIDGLRATLASLGVPPVQVRFEAFQGAAAPPPAAASRAVTASSSPGGGTLRFARSGRAAAPAPRQTLLEAAEAAGVEIPSSCRAGVCLTCRTRVLEGEVDCASDTLDPDDRRDGYVLPCVSWLRGPCVLDA